MDMGIFVGVVDKSDEILWAVPDGVVKARDVRRQPDEDRWDRDRVKAIAVSPMAPTAGVADMRVKTYIRPGLLNPEVPRPTADRAATSRRCRLTRKDFEDYGLTVGCGGYKAIARRSTDSVNHSEQCRNRIEKELMKSAEGATRVNNFCSDGRKRWRSTLRKMI